MIVLPSAMQIVLAPLCALISQRLARRGYSSRVSRGVLGTGCVTIAGVSMVCMPFVEMGVLKIVLIGLSFSIGSVIFTLGSTLIGEISPASQRGAALGVTNSVHTLAGLFAPVVMGGIVDVGVNTLQGFQSGYVCAGIFVAAMGLIAAALIHPESDLIRFRQINARSGIADEPAY